MIFVKTIIVFGGEHPECATGVSNSLEAFRGFAEFILKVYYSMESKSFDFNSNIYAFGGEHAESAIEVSNSLGAFRGFAELILNVCLSMESNIDGLPKEKSCFR